MTHICVSKLTTIGSDNGLSPGRCQAIIWINAGILFIGPLGTNFSEIYIEILTFLFKKMHLKVSSAKWRPFFLGFNVLSSIIALMPHEQYGHLPARPPDCHLNIETPSYQHRNSIIKIRRFHDRLIFIMEIPMPGKSSYWNRPLAALPLCLLLCMAEWWPDYLLHWVHCTPPIVTHLGTNTAPGNIGKPAET